MIDFKVSGIESAITPSDFRLTGVVLRELINLYPLVS
jgi:hypothetical protein